MQTLFIISLSASFIGALLWFSIWAFWLHPPEGWLGNGIISRVSVQQNEAIRHSRGFRLLKVGTLLLWFATAALFVQLLVEQGR
jgi:hypothetical protein